MVRFAESGRSRLGIRPHRLLPSWRAGVVPLLATLPALLLGSAAAHGQTVVSPIYGAYDAECGANIDCSFGTGLPVVQSGGTQYDTPSLFIVNNTANAFTGGTLTLTGYQSQVNGYSATVALPDIAAGTVYDIQWGAPLSVSGANPILFSYDYDDQFGGGFENISGCVQPYSFCTYVGNFNVAFNALTAGQPISALFSPDNTQPYSNAAGKFVGFEGLDPTGLTETTYDDHTASQPGVLAYIYTGTNGVQTGAVPEPSTWAMLLLGFGAIGFTMRRKKSAPGPSRVRTAHA